MSGVDHGSLFFSVGVLHLVSRPEKGPLEEGSFVYSVHEGQWWDSNLCRLWQSVDENSFFLADHDHSLLDLLHKGFVRGMSDWVIHKILVDCTREVGMGADRVVVGPFDSSRVI